MDCDLDGLMLGLLLSADGELRAGSSPLSPELSPPFIDEKGETDRSDYVLHGMATFPQGIPIQVYRRSISWRIICK